MAEPYLVQQNKPLYDPRTTSSYAAISGVSDSGLELIRKGQQEHPEWYPQNYKMAFDTFAENVENKENPNAPPAVPQSPSAPKAAKAKTKPATIDYFNADLAKKYGMSKSTAYQEAMANTSYQRAVKDMQAAGLNPAVLFGGGRATPANSAVYAAEHQTGGSGSGGSYGRSGGYSGSNGKLFSSSAYSAMSAAGGMVGIAATGRPDGYWVGSSITQGVMSFLDALFK